MIVSREEAAAFLRNLQLNLDSVQVKIDARLNTLPRISQDELTGFLLETRLELETWHNDQMQEIQTFLSQVDCKEASTPSGAEQVTPFGAQLRSLEDRIAAIGGRPALGSVVLPRLTPGGAVLNTTASPAAIEILRNKLGNEVDGAKAMHKMRKEDNVAKTPVVQLRSVSATLEERTPSGNVAPDSELARVFQRRADRQSPP